MSQSGISILNDVLGPVMRGPSSSHTAASYNLGRLAAALFHVAPSSVQVAFDPAGSYGQVYRQQGVDLGFATGLLGLPLTDSSFFQALEIASVRGIALRFDVRTLDAPDHPNTTDILMNGPAGESLELRARSVGGGAVEITRVNKWPVLVTGQTYEVLIETTAAAAPQMSEIFERDTGLIGKPVRQAGPRGFLLHLKRRRPLGAEMCTAITAADSRAVVREAPPIAFVKQGRPLFNSAAGMLALAEERGCSLANIAIAHEAALLGMTDNAVFEEMGRRVEVMLASVREGLGKCVPQMQLLSPCAGAIFEADKAGALPMGGTHTRAAARALAVMHVNSAMGVVCAAPTGGSAGVLPGVLATLLEERGLGRERAIKAAFTAGAIGVIVGERATFAAEVAGCQVEIGAAGAMAAAAAVEAGQGKPRQAADAAAISFQNTMGSVCDLVQGMVEVPCHTRNAAAASNAFVCADLAVGGYGNPIPLDETVDAVLAVGRMLPCELRVTSRGGLAVTPSALNLKRRQ